MGFETVIDEAQAKRISRLSVGSRLEPLPCKPSSLMLQEKLTGRPGMEGHEVMRGELYLRAQITQGSSKPGTELIIEVQRADGLVPLDKSTKLSSSGGTLTLSSTGYPHPYVRLSVGNQEKKTTVKPETLTPVWDESFTFDFKKTQDLHNAEVRLQNEISVIT